MICAWTSTRCACAATSIHLGILLHHLIWLLICQPSAGLDSGGVIAQGFRGSSNHEWDQTMLKIFKLQIKPQALPVSDFSILTKPTYRNTVA